jgi:hypothetical protein
MWIDTRKTRQASSPKDSDSIITAPVPEGQRKNKVAAQAGLVYPRRMRIQPIRNIKPIPANIPRNTPLTSVIPCSPDNDLLTGATQTQHVRSVMEVATAA